jgi:bla regulator protein BlaR1
VTSLSMLEVFLSLTAQVTFLIGVAAYFARRQQPGRNGDVCWAALHVCILLITAAAFFLPHVRLTTWADLHPAENYPAGNSALHRLGSAIGWTWGLGVVTVFAVGVATMIKAIAIVRRAQIDDALRKQMLVSVPGLASQRRPIDVRLSDACTGAFCWQIHRPMIAVPKVVLEFPVAEQAAIVRHELAHLRRHHPLHLFLQRLVEAIYWFHPLVWWSSRQAAAAREFQCDRDAVTSRNDVAVYLRSLLRLVELQLNAPSLLPAGLGFLGNGSLLGRRANLLADSFDSPIKSQSRWRPVLALAAAVFACALVWLPVNPRASRRADWSPWPNWSARSLEAVGIDVRDYEVDGYRLDGHEHTG